MSNEGSRRGENASGETNRAVGLAPAVVSVDLEQSDDDNDTDGDTAGRIGVEMWDICGSRCFRKP